jgi:hypothetical protein
MLIGHLMSLAQSPSAGARPRAPKLETKVVWLPSMLVIGVASSK